MPPGNLLASLCPAPPFPQELEKFKFVLEYSIGELRAQLDPKEAELGAVKEKLEVRGGSGGSAGRLAAPLSSWACAPCSTG